MDISSKRCSGFGLIEVIISMAIMGVISMSVYTGYILSIKHTKEGQVKQAAALEGKKAIEEIKSNNTNIVLSADTFKIDNTTLTKYKNADDTSAYKTYLNENYEDKNSDGTDISAASRKYTEIVTITPTKAKDSLTNTLNEVEFNQQMEIDKNDINYNVYMSNQKISDTETKEYISDSATTLNETSLDGGNTITLFMYIVAASDNSISRTITINDRNGQKVLENILSAEATLDNVNIIINFDNYQQRDSCLLKPVTINVYNTTSANIPNIYLQKSSDLNVNIKSLQGTINSYNNQSAESKILKLGTLYDVKVEIKDYISDSTLFTAYYKQNFN